MKSILHSKKKWTLFEETVLLEVQKTHLFMQFSVPKGKPVNIFRITVIRIANLALRIFAVYSHNQKIIRSTSLQTGTKNVPSLKKHQNNLNLIV